MHNRGCLNQMETRELNYDTIVIGYTNSNGDGCINSRTFLGKVAPISLEQSSAESQKHGPLKAYTQTNWEMGVLPTK